MNKVKDRLFVKKVNRNGKAYLFGVKYTCNGIFDDYTEFYILKKSIFSYKILFTYSVNGKCDFIDHNIDTIIFNYESKRKFLEDLEKWENSKDES